MIVLIVAKTRRGTGACVGGISAEGRSVRLIAHDAATNERAGLEYQVGDVWELETSPATGIVPPHVEDVVVRTGRRLRSSDDPVSAIMKFMPPVQGGPDLLFQGLAQRARSGALYIASAAGLPEFSTGFWRPDRPLLREETGKRIRYRYVAPGSSSSLVFVGFQDPPPAIEAGAVVRVSLAHWWRSDDHPEDELRCYLQLSGWFPSPDGCTRAATGLQAAPLSRGASTSPTGPADLPSPLPPDVEGCMPDARARLKSVFGHDAFRPLQEQIVRNLLSRRDTLAVMPTGSGKSLCFQLPALLLDGLTVVVSPLVALMQDQVDGLRQLGVPAVFLNSTQTYAEYRVAAQQVRARRARLLYVAPETLLKPEILVLLEGARPALFVIDEAHCISAWGHDFRPDYRELLRVRLRFPQAVCAAFTATATPRVQEDIRECLALGRGDVFIASFNRENLYLAAQPRRDEHEQILEFLLRHPGQPGIIYAPTRLDVELMSARLAGEGFSILPYHAGLDAETRRANQRSFQNDDVQIIVATIAFGLGINKPNVRWIVNTALPENLETYYQQIGRAGRDGERADCLLLHSTADVVLTQRFIREGAASERAGRKARLEAMALFAQSGDCRRSRLLAYFGESLPAQRCGFCDNCEIGGGAGLLADVTEAARLFLQGVLQTGQRFGRSHVAAVLRGSRSRDVRRTGHDGTPVHGAGRALAAKDWESLAEQLVRAGYLEREQEHATLRLTDRGRKALAGEPVAVAASGSPFDLSAGPGSSSSSAADSRGAAPISLSPLAPGHAAALSGNGPAPVDRPRAQPAPSPHSPEPGSIGAHPPRTRRVRRWKEVGSRFASGETVESLCLQYGVVRATILNHLCRFVAFGGTLAPGRVLDLCRMPDEQRAGALDALAELGEERLTPVFEALNGAVPYEELHVLRLYLRCLQSQVSSGASVGNTPSGHPYRIPAGSAGGE
jgi:ATP-dependent DNA helicase RecQ